jgi:hypothetical protein
MTWTSIAQFQKLTIVPSASITTSFVLVATLASSAVLIACKNGTNGDVLISFNGTTAVWGFPASSGSVYDIKTNSPKISELMLPANTPLFISWNTSAPGSPTGNVYIEIMEVQVT